eukprot:3682127-Rhodomonas_salina.3
MAAASFCCLATNTTRGVTPSCGSKAMHANAVSKRQPAVAAATTAGTPRAILRTPSEEPRSVVFVPLYFRPCYHPKHRFCIFIRGSSVPASSSRSKVSVTSLTLNNRCTGVSRSEKQEPPCEMLRFF